MGGGPPGFTQGFTYPVLLGNLKREINRFRLRGYHPLWRSFPNSLGLTINFVTLCLHGSAGLSGPATPNGQHLPAVTPIWFGLIPVRSPLLRESLLLSLPGGSKMFQFPPFASWPYVFRPGYPRFARVGFPIGRSPDQSLLTAPRGLSQLTTSFIAFWYQGIHRIPFSA